MPETTLNNNGTPSVVQAVEVSVSSWRLGRRYEAATQLLNVGDGAPLLRYWDPHRDAVDRWVATDAHPMLTAGWHDVVLEARVVGDNVHYDGFAFDGVSHAFDVANVPPACNAAVPDKWAFAVQSDGNADGTAYDVALADVTLTVCEDPGAFESPEPAFSTDRCGLGELLDGLQDASGCEPGAYQCFHGVDANVTLAPAAGCHGEPESALSLHYALPASPDADWVSIHKDLPAPLDLSAAAYLLFPFKGDPSALARTVEVKLEDADGCRSAVLFTAASNLPVWRTTVVSLAQFSRSGQSTCGVGEATDLGRITALEIGISEIGADVPDPNAAAVGTLLFDDITFVTAEELQRDVDHYECALRDDATMTAIAESMMARQDPGTGLVPTWYEEPAATYNAYAQALGLIVLSLESSRTGTVQHATAATRLADTLVRLQSSDGSWVTNLEPATTAPPNSGDVWVGNVSWIAIALRTFLNEVAPPERTAYDSSIEAAHAFLLDQIAAFEQQTGLSGGITTGTEGNISSFFALRAAGDLAAADRVAQFLLDHAWDAERGHFRMGSDYDGLALDVMAWGAELLRLLARDDLARQSLGAAAEVFPVMSWSGDMTAMGDIAGPWQPTTEFTCQYAAAGGPGAAWFVQQLMPLQANPGEFRAAPMDYAGGDGWNTPMTGVPPSAWMYIGLRGGLLQGL